MNWKYKRIGWRLENFFEDSDLPLRIRKFVFNESVLANIDNSTCKDYFDLQFNYSMISKVEFDLYNEIEKISESLIFLNTTYSEHHPTSKVIMRLLAFNNHLRLKKSAEYDKFLKCLTTILIKFANKDFNGFMCSCIPQLYKSCKEGMLTKESAEQLIRIVLKNQDNIQARNLDVSSIWEITEICLQKKKKNN